MHSVGADHGEAHRISAPVRKAHRAVLVAVGVVHLPYPLALLWATAAGVESSSLDAGTALIVVPILLVLVAVVIWPLAWRAWRGRVIAPFSLASVLALESWLYRNGTRTEFWDEPGEAERLATFQLATHVTVLIALVATTTAVVASRTQFRRRAQKRAPTSVTRT